MTTPGTTSSTSSRSAASSRSSVRTCCACETDRGSAPALRMAGRETRRAPVASTPRGLPQPLHAERRRLLLPRPARPARGSVHAPALDHARGRVRAAAAPCGSWRRSPTSTSSSPPPSIRCSSRRSTSSASAAPHRPKSIAYAPNRVADLPAEREPAAATGGLSPARPAVGVADLRDLRRGHARVHLRAAVRAPDAREAVPRARAQPPAAHRQQLLQLARAPVPAHGQAQAPVRSARRRRGACRRPLRCKDERLVAFLQQVSVRTRVYSGAEAFVAELHRALDRAPAAARPRHPRPAAAPQRFLPPTREMPDNAIFISYAREDLRRRAAAEGGARRGRPHDLVRPRPARRRRRLRPQDPAQHRALLLLHPGRFGNDAAAARRLFPARVELRGRPRAQHRRGRACSSCRSASTTRRRPRRWCRTSSRPCTSRACRTASRPPEFAAPAARTLQRRAAHERIAARPTVDAVRSRSIRRESVARPGLVHRGDARATSTAATRKSAELAPPRAAQAAHGPVRPVGPRQDVDRCAPASCRGCAARAICPVYVRIDYSPESPPPSEQIKQAIFRATAAAGHWTRPGTADRRRVAVGVPAPPRRPAARRERHARCMPLLIFDQFEEIFTLAQADDSGRQRASAVPRGPGRPRREPPARGARGAARR